MTTIGAKQNRCEKRLIFPRQAWYKHRENTQKKRRFSQAEDRARLKAEHEQKLSDLREAHARGENVLGILDAGSLVSAFLMFARMGRPLSLNLTGSRTK